VLFSECMRKCVQKLLDSGRHCQRRLFRQSTRNPLSREVVQDSIGRRITFETVTFRMTNANTLDRWRPHPLVVIYCVLAIVLLGAACYWGIVLVCAQWYQPESAVKAAYAGTALSAVVFLLSLRRCSTPALPAFRGLLMITAYMTIGVGSFFLLFVIPAVVFAIVSTVAIAFMSLFRKDTAYARQRFRQLVEFYRKHRMYQ
jgi:hypothetical protein